MRRLRPLALALLLAGCSPAADAPDRPFDLPPPVSKVTRGAAEPDRVVVQHVLIGCLGSAVEVPERPADEARTLALALRDRIRAGEDMEALVREHSDDFDPAAQGPPGVYRIANIDVAPAPGELPRQHLARGFGDLAFSLSVGDLGVVEWSAENSPLGFHVVRRLE